MSLADAGQRLTVTPNESGFGAEVTGLDLARPLAPDTLAAVKAAFLAHGVLWFPDQPLDHDQLEAFTLQFGEFGWDPYIAPLADRPHILEVRREADEKTTVFGGGWHSDWSFQVTPPAATILHAKVVPPVGGDTLYADGVAAYEALSPAFRDMLAPLQDHPLGDAALRSFRPLRQGGSRPQHEDPVEPRGGQDAKSTRWSARWTTGAARSSSTRPTRWASRASRKPRAPRCWPSSSST